MYSEKIQGFPSGPGIRQIWRLACGVFAISMNIFYYFDMGKTKANEKNKIEKVRDIPIYDPDIFENDINYYLNEYITINNIQDFKKEAQSQFNAACIYINKHCIPRPMLFINNNPAAPNWEAIDNIADHYINIALVNNKAITLTAFALLIGFDITAVDKWRLEPTTARYRIYQKIFSFYERTLTDRLSDGKQNPVGIIATLNHFYNWQTASAAVGTAPVNHALSAESLPKLAEIPQTNNNIIEAVKHYQ